MRGGINNRGYTVVEVLLFMAISGLMFIVAANFISGRQAKAEFRQGMNNITAELTAITNDVNNGYFPANSGVKCSALSPGTPNTDDGSPVGREQGANQGCVFMGKIFGLAGSNSDGHSYTVYTVAGRQFRTTPEDNIPPRSFSEAYPAVVDKLTQTNRFQWGPTLVKMTNKGSSISAIGFFTGFGRDVSNLYRENGGTLVVPILGPIGGFNKDSVATTGPLTTASGYDALTDPAPNIVLCFDSGFGYWGTVTLGGDTPGQRTSIKAKIYTVKPSGGIC